MSEEPTPKKKRQKLRNPSPDDFQGKQKVVQAIPESQYIEEEADIPKEYQSLKPKSSKFEPNPIQYELPSKNFVIKPHLAPEGKIFVRRMTTLEEGYIKEVNTPKEMLNLINKILDGCIRTNISVRNLALVDKITLFLFVLGLTYGKKHEVNLMCPECGIKRMRQVDFDKDIKIKYIPDNFKNPKSYKLHSQKGITIYYRIPLIADEDIMLADETQKVNLTDQIYALTSQIIGTDPEGNPIEKRDYKEIIQNMDFDDRKDFRSFLTDTTEYGSDIAIHDFQCENQMCDKMGEEQKADLPLDEILLKVFS